MKIPRQTIRQLTDAERAALDADDSVTSCAAEVVGANASTRLGRAKATAGKVFRNISGVVARTFNRQNVDVALTGSTNFAKLVAKDGVDAARDAVIRRVRKGVEEKIGSVIGGDGAKVK